MTGAVRTARAEIRSAAMVRHKVWAAELESRKESVWDDARYGFRQIPRSPGLSIVAILSLALGIGANTAIFTVIDDLPLKQLPVHDPNLHTRLEKQALGGDRSKAGTLMFQA
jgi:hypothetical protein